MSSIKRTLTKAFSCSWLFTFAFVAFAKLAEYVQEGSAGITFIEVYAFIGMGLGISLIAIFIAGLAHASSGTQLASNPPQKPAQ